MIIFCSLSHIFIVASITSWWSFCRSSTVPWNHSKQVSFSHHSNLYETYLRASLPLWLFPLIYSTTDSRNCHLIQFTQCHITTSNKIVLSSENIVGKSLQSFKGGGGHQTEWHSNARLIYICIQHWKVGFLKAVKIHLKMAYYVFIVFKTSPLLFSFFQSKGQRGKKCKSKRVRILTKISWRGGGHRGNKCIDLIAFYFL